MVDHDLFHRELANLPTIAGNDLHEGLYQLSVTAAAALGVDGAGVTLRMPNGVTEYITATDPTTMRVEKQQDALRQGACVDAIQSSQVVAVGDLTDEPRWPQFTPFVLQSGFRAVAGVPIPFQGQNIGALNLYANSSRMWTTEEFAAGRVLADLAAGYLINAHLLQTTQTLAAQLQQALDSRVMIEQAKGVIAGRYGLTPEAAFGLLRNFARSHRLNIQEVATDVVTGRADLVGNASERGATAS